MVSCVNCEVLSSRIVFKQLKTVGWSGKNSSRHAGAMMPHKHFYCLVPERGLGVGGAGVGVPVPHLTKRASSPAYHRLTSQKGPHCRIIPWNLT